MKFNEYRENKIHGTPRFPLEYYYVDEKHTQYVMPLHWHSEFEVLRVLRGRLALYLNNEIYDLRAGDVIFIPPGTLHRGDPIDCVYDCAVFDLRLASGYYTSKLSDLIQPIISSDAEITHVCDGTKDSATELLDTVAEEKPYFELKVASLIAEIIYKLYSSGNVAMRHIENKRIAHQRALMTLLIEKIEKDYAEKITLADLAEIAQMNEKYLCRFFKGFTGQTPIDYINRLRIDRACYEMTVNKMTVTSAAYECGFNELSYFSKMFKKYKGVSPGQYRQRFALQ